MRAALAVFVLALVAAVSAAAAIRPDGLVLHASDLPHGMKLVPAASGRYPNVNAAAGNAAGARNFVRWGWVSGYHAEYRSVTGHAADSSGLLRVITGAFVFRDEHGANLASRSGGTAACAKLP